MLKNESTLYLGEIKCTYWDSHDPDGIGDCLAFLVAQPGDGPGDEERRIKLRNGTFWQIGIVKTN